MGYYDDWDEGREYVDIPTEAQIIDWNIHNDHQNDNEDFDEPYLCDWCEKPLHPDSNSDMCDDCIREYDLRHPHPLDIAEREELEDRSAGLDLPWKGEF